MSLVRDVQLRLPGLRLLDLQSVFGRLTNLQPLVILFLPALLLALTLWTLEKAFLMPMNHWTPTPPQKTDHIFFSVAATLVANTVLPGLDDTYYSLQSRISSVRSLIPDTKANSLIHAPQLITRPLASNLFVILWSPPLLVTHACMQHFVLSNSGVEE